MSYARNTLGALTRALPHVKGHGWVCRHLCATFAPHGRGDVVTVPFRDGSRMRLDLGSPTEQLAFWLGEYDGPIIRRLATCLTPGSVVLDIGANVGFYSIALGLHVRAKGGQLYAFEPVRSNFERLSEMVELNGLGGVVKPVPVALGEEEGEVPFHLEESESASTGNAIMVRGGVAEVAAANTSARLTRLDDLAEKEGIGSCRLVKIDVEGAELMAFRGGIGFLTQHRPIIFGEFNSYWMERFGHSLMDVVDLLRPLDYRYFRKVRKADFVPVEHLENGLEDLLLVPADCPDATLKGLGVVPS